MATKSKLFRRQAGDSWIGRFMMSQFRSVDRSKIKKKIGASGIEIEIESGGQNKKRGILKFTFFLSEVFSLYRSICHARSQLI